MGSIQTANGNDSLLITGNDGTDGEIIITELTATKVVGTFSFDAKNASDSSIKMLSNGTFNVSL